MNRRTFLKALGVAGATAAAPGAVAALIPDHAASSPATDAAPAVGQLRETIYRRVDLIGKPWQIHYEGVISGVPHDLSIMSDRAPTKRDLVLHYRPLAVKAMNRAATMDRVAARRYRK